MKKVKESNYGKKRIISRKNLQFYGQKCNKNNNWDETLRQILFIQINYR